MKKIRKFMSYSAFKRPIVEEVFRLAAEFSTGRLGALGRK